VLRIVRTYARVNELPGALSVDAPDAVSRSLRGFGEPSKIDVRLLGDGTQGADRAAKVASWL
jgi:hypothetical protein